MMLSILNVLLALVLAGANPPVVHPTPGVTRLDADSVVITFVTRKQN